MPIAMLTHHRVGRKGFQLRVDCPLEGGACDASLAIGDEVGKLSHQRFVRDLTQHRRHEDISGAETALEIVLLAKPARQRSGRSRGLDLACIVFGAGLSLALDEVVYLIATDGSNPSYLLPVSFWGAVVVVGLGALWILLVGWRNSGGPDR